ncbi:MAG: hypothetical protein ACHREM_27105, partial [Polyangiales bacterium]
PIDFERGSADMTSHPRSWIRPVATLSLAFASALIACGGSSPPARSAAPKDDAPDAAVVATIDSTSAAAPIATASAPAAGAERRFARIGWYGSKPEEEIPVSIDVPAEWSLRSERFGTPTFRACHTASPIGGELTVMATTCSDDLEACAKKVVGEELASAKRDAPAADRQWAILDRDVHGHRQIDAWMFVVEPRKKKILECTAIFLSGTDLDRFVQLKAACESLAFPSSVTPSAPVAARATASDLAVPTSDPERSIHDVAVRFLSAAGARDTKTASTLLIGEESCPEKPAKIRASCRSQVASIRTAVPKLLESFPKGFDPGSVEIAPIGDASAKAYSVTVHAKSDECGQGVGITVAESKGRYVVAFGMRRE